MQQSSPVLQQQLHPGALHTLHQSPDGTLYPQQTLPELQNLHTHDVYQAQQQQQPYALSGPPPPPAHALSVHQYEQHGLPPSASFPPYPATYQHATSPRFVNAPPPPLQGPAQHYHSPQPPTPLPQRPIQQLPLPPPLPILTLPQSAPRHIEHAQPVLQPDAPEGDESPFTNHGQFQGLKLIPNPPDLDSWRERLFNVDDMITLTEEEFQTYFPHIDNVYSHRSTQRHKRKRFVSHYWDCRLKGRPPGTKKSTDPDKKKRKRVARERDLCDVKIKITEFFDQREYEEQLGQRPPGASELDPTNPLTAGISASMGGNTGQTQTFYGQQHQMLQQQQVGGWDMPPNLGQPGMSMPQYAPGPPLPPDPPARKFYTFQRVNGNGGNGKGDGVAGPHKHSLEESDRVKKNSVLRWQAKMEKDDRKKVQGGDATKKTYHKKATGNALTTVKNHSKDDELKLYGSAFCPFVQRVWISLEHKRLPYQYIEVDPYKKPQSLLDVNPRGLVPALRHGPTWSTHESTVIMEYLEDLAAGPPLLPLEAQSRATSRLWTDHINRHIIPFFYKLLQAQSQPDQIKHATELRTQIGKLVDVADPQGPFFLGPQMSFVDVQIAPWALRLKRVLVPYRGWPEAEEGSRWRKWVDAIEGERSVRMTTSTDELYLDSYERYAENRPGTSLLADAVNSGRVLP
ncbi:hypothetical protein T440DRAFT_383910 [Plenodomus tracheiphilus IPT5]|uniref:GST N-terminal domain-containing protein n=1 Tax=Plenodomus tracheiphilus IPT5 TaxID=1408161 RepID=A0A6A7BNS9_9PLEO|nr:hypothetical protein T440DRAFT_383910 [Plenodomus tracheiphilus IPT5]